MFDADRGRRVVMMEPLVRDAFDKVSKVVKGMGEGEVMQTLAAMANDGAESFIWECIEVHAWDRYEAGGPLEAEDAELTVSPELSGLTRERLLDILTRYHQGRNVRFLPTDDPWKVLVRAPGMPGAVVYVMPRPMHPLDLTVRVVLGKRDDTPNILPSTAISLWWQETTAAAMQQWVEINRHRPLSDHPAFEHMVQTMQPGLPGLYVIRTPPVPFSPVLPVETYERRAGAAVFETSEEFDECERFYREVGVAFFETAPLFRNRPPCSYRPARLAGGIKEGGAMIVQTPWSDVGAVSVYALPSTVLARRPDLKQSAFRERYGVQFDRDMATAAAFWRRFPGSTGFEITRSEHPRAQRRA